MFGTEVDEHTGLRSKTYHIGEYCKHGTVSVEYDDNARFTIRFYKYKTKENMESALFDFVDKYKMQMYLEDMMSSYNSDKIMKDFYG